MKESVAIAKEAEGKKGFSFTKSDNSIHRVQDGPERHLGSLRAVIGNITRNGGTPSVDSIATELSGMHSIQRAPALLALQQTHGNRYVQRVVVGIQAKLKVGQPGDVYEQEADRVAEEVMRMPEPQVERQAEEEKEMLQTKPMAEQITPLLRRQIGPEEEEEEILQTKKMESTTTEITDDLESEIPAIRDGGQPLAESERAFFEQRFGYDFSQIPLYANPRSIIQPKRKANASGDIVNSALETHETARRGLSGSAKPLPHLDMIQQSFGRYDVTGVKAYVGGPARESNELMGTFAYTTNNSVAFKQFPDRHTAAHEAAHIVQQQAGVQLQGGVGQSGDRYEQNADAVADAVVNGHSAEPLLDRYARPHSMYSNLVQFQVCEDLRSTLSNSEQVIELYREFLEGNIEWEEVQEHTEMIGNAALGVVGEGLELPQIVQDAVNEVENFGFEELRHLVRMIVSLPSLVVGSSEFFQSQYVRNEIERQNHYNRIIIRYMYENACPDVPGQWTDYQQQILPIGTRGVGQRSSIETRETRTAVAWVEVGDEHVLVLATEVASAGGLRFERWIDSEFRELALRQARSIQGSIPSVPASAVRGLPSSVPSSAARR